MRERICCSTATAVVIVVLMGDLVHGSSVSIAF